MVHSHDAMTSKVPPVPHHVLATETRQDLELITVATQSTISIYRTINANLVNKKHFKYLKN